MVEIAPIHITIDQDTLRAQVDGVIAEAVKQFAFRLHRAADDLDPSITDEMMEYQYQLGYEAGYEAGKGDDE